MIHVNSRQFTSIFIFMVLFGSLFVSCGANLKSPADMSPVELSTWAMSVYNAQYDTYNAQAALPLTEEQTKVLRVKKEALGRLWEPLKLYAAYVDTGSVPPEELEGIIINSVNALVALVE